MKRPSRTFARSITFKSTSNEKISLYYNRLALLAIVSWEGGILVGEVVNMSADESILTDGKVDLAKLKPIVFDAAAMSYRAIGEEVGKAWGAGMKFSE